MERVIFLDRDGTLNEEVNYLHRKEDMKLLAGVPEAIRMLQEHGFKIVVITNQAGVARGYYSEEDVHVLHAYMNEMLEPQCAKIDAFFYCPHHPEHGIGEYKKACHCRKPETGMFEQAESLFDVDKAHSWMIGDKLIDVQAGRNYGVRTVLVGTGYGAAEHAKAEAENGAVEHGKALAEAEAGTAEHGKVSVGTGVRAVERGKVLTEAGAGVANHEKVLAGTGTGAAGTQNGGQPYDVYAETLIDAARAIIGEGNPDGAEA